MTPAALKTVAVRVLGVAYAAALAIALLVFWHFMDAARANGAVAWRPFFVALGDSVGALDPMVRWIGAGLADAIAGWAEALRDVEVTAEMRAFRLPFGTPLFEARTAVFVALAIVFLGLANWLWRQTLGRLDP